MSKISFDGRVAIVTGAGGGLGRDYALDLARRGAAVVVNDLGSSFDGQGGSARMADAVVAEIVAAGGRAVASYDSVSTSAGGEAIGASAVKAFGKIDVLINNAGILRNSPFESLPDSTIDAMLDVHLKGAFYVTRPAFKLMKQQRYGRILFASSAAGMFGNDEQAAYGAAKGGVVGLMNVLSQEGRAFNINCNALLPTAESRMAAAMPQSQMDAVVKMFTEAHQYIGKATSPAFVTPIVTYLVSEHCQSTHGIYSTSLGRYARVFVAASSGWIGPREAPPSAEDIAANFAAICNQKSTVVPESLHDEFVLIVDQLKRAR
jgi:NAD(P)-dependent dehydrogenase (short-subunit alcohol dehydrogenase family)